MHTIRKQTTLFILAAFALLATGLTADTVETKSGARLMGRLVKINGGAVVLDTDYAGTITIKQSEVQSLHTASPVAIRLVSGTRVDGTVTGSAGTLQVANTDGTISTTIDKVAASWAAGGQDPQVTALQRKWRYEASVDINGKSGNKSQLGTTGALRATLAGAEDTLVFYTGYDRQVTDGAKSADQFKAGVDYANNFSRGNSWYVRDEGGFDRIKGIGFYNVAATGFGYDFIKKADQSLTGRVGLSFRNENYKSPLTADVNAAGLDFGLNHALKRGNWSLVNRFSLVPAFEDLANFRLTHESFLELPMANPNWKVRFGVSNDYNSRPGAGVKKLDTGYFSRLVLNWE